MRYGQTKAQRDDESHQLLSPIRTQKYFTLHVAQTLPVAETQLDAFRGVRNLSVYRSPWHLELVDARKVSTGMSRRQEESLRHNVLRYSGRGMAFILSLDEGTTSARAALYDSEGRNIGMESAPVTCFYPQPGWVEQDANQVWSAQIESARRLMERCRADAANVAAIGITNQRETRWCGIAARVNRCLRRSFGSAVERPISARNWHAPPMPRKLLAKPGSSSMPTSPEARSAGSSTTCPMPALVRVMEN